MRTKIAARLRDTRGATILMALLALLVVAMVATTILAAANSTVRQAKADQQLQQDTLSLQSAGSFISKDISGFKVVASCPVKRTRTEGGAWSDPSFGEWEYSSKGDSYFSDQLLEAVKATYPNGPSSGGTAGVPAEGEAEISATFKNSVQGLDETHVVKASFSMSCKSLLDVAKTVKEGKLVFTLKSADAGTTVTGAEMTGIDPQVLYLTFSTGVDNPNETIEWDSVLPSGGEQTGVLRCTYSWTREGYSTSKES